MSGYGRDESAPTPGGMFATHFVGVLCVFRWWALHYRNPSAMLLQCVQNTFTECSQRVRYLCVTYSPCKSMVFALQKYGFWRAKRGFLHCKSMVFVFWMLCCCNLFRMLSQSVRSEMAIRQQHYRKPSAAVGVRFIVPAYPYTPTKWRTEMCVWWCGNVCAMKWIHIFGYANTRFCLCQDTGAMNQPLRLTDCSPRIHGTNVVYWGGMQS